MKIDRQLLLLATGHGINDLVAGYFLGCLVQQDAGSKQVAMGLIIYNLLAFGGQFPVALWLEKLQSPRPFLLVSYALNVAAVALSPWLLPVSIILAGIGSALYHVAGGAVCAAKGNAATIGLFAAPGVVGLIAGGYFAYAGFDLFAGLLIFTIMLFLLLAISTFSKRREMAGATEGRPDNSYWPDRHDLVMMLLLTAIALRSVVWNTFQLIHEENYTWLIAIALSAAAGKIAGGWIADKIGWRLYAILSLVISTPLVSLFKKELVLFCIGIGLLQSGIPATTALLVKAMPGKAERAVGLSFGTAIILGALAFYTPVRNTLAKDMAVFSMSLLGLIFLLLAVRSRAAWSPSVKIKI